MSSFAVSVCLSVVREISLVNGYTTYTLPIVLKLHLMSANMSAILYISTDSRQYGHSLVSAIDHCYVH